MIEGNQSRLKLINDVYESKLTRQLWEERDRKAIDEFNKISTHFINECLKYGITEVIMGYNKNWKSKVNVGKKTNDAFYKIPYRKLVNMIFYKGEENGIIIRENEENYTSKCDALAFEEIRKHKKYSGKRKKRGLFQSRENRKGRVLINADVNAAINIFRKGIATNIELLKKLEIMIQNYNRVCNPRIMKLNRPLNVLTRGAGNSDRHP